MLQIVIVEGTTKLTRDTVLMSIWAGTPYRATVNKSSTESEVRLRSQHPAVAKFGVSISAFAWHCLVLTDWRNKKTLLAHGFCAAPIRQWSPD